MYKLSEFGSEWYQSRSRFAIKNTNFLLPLSLVHVVAVTCALSTTIFWNLPLARLEEIDEREQPSYRIFSTLAVNQGMSQNWTVLATTLKSNSFMLASLSSFTTSKIPQACLVIRPRIPAWLLLRGGLRCQGISEIFAEHKGASAGLLTCCVDSCVTHFLFSPDKVGTVVGVEMSKIYRIYDEFQR